MDLEKLRDTISKKAKGAHVSILSQSEIAASKEWIATPAYDLNRILSGSLFKGLPNKTFTLFVGPETSGKSSFICLCLAEAQRKGYTPVIIDTEGAWDVEFVKRWGIDPDKMLYNYTPFVDQASVILGNLFDSGETKLAIAIDSIGGLDRKKLIDDALLGDMKADQGQLQKALKQTLKLILAISKMRESLVLAAGHYYGSPSTYGDADQIGGGFAAKLLPDIIVSLKKDKLWENPNAKASARGEVLGAVVKAITLKNRYYPAFQEALIEIDYRSGINKYAGLMDLALKSEYVTVAGSWYTVGKEKAQGSIAATELLKKDKKFLEFTEKWLEKTGYSSVNQEIAEAIALVEEEKLEEKTEETEVEVEKPKAKGGISIKRKNGK